MWFCLDWRHFGDLSSKQGYLTKYLDELLVIVLVRFCIEDAAGVRGVISAGQVDRG
ncbi:hypothetical protein RchiOBHm_Chr7g0220821 [Rosa chinensis]|uniref:Uncharacterized protein n=1 Tax=Rosa chinensis TaxID=74649 RepID=A0A2P6PCW4_ROSCH|nr:hypothetical protein RchiOBHm_Chr7g0220821 [Rosa chinensis]